jgi:hypothetical protein
VNKQILRARIFAVNVSKQKQPPFSEAVFVCWARIAGEQGVNFLLINAGQEYYYNRRIRRVWKKEISEDRDL